MTNVDNPTQANALQEYQRLARFTATIRGCCINHRVQPGTINCKATSTLMTTSTDREEVRTIGTLSQLGALSDTFRCG